MATEADLRTALHRAWALERQLWAALRHVRALVEEGGLFHPHCPQCQAVDALLQEHAAPVKTRRRA